MAEFEKITINLSVVDLGSVDLLVDQGFYGSRTDFVRAAIRAQLDKHAGEVDRVVHTKTMVLGVTKIGRKDLEAAARRHERLKLQVLGVLIIDQDVPAALFSETVEAVQVYGSIRASADVRRVIEGKHLAE
jgi:Arc/MetJ-type ribon-helix-helix transcriptional regulator